MSLKTGIVGLPNVGKVRHLHNPSGLHAAESVMHLFCQCTLIGLLERPKSTSAAQSTLFNAICENGKAQAANFPFCTIEPNVGIVAVPDPRLQVRFDSDSRALIFILHPMLLNNAQSSCAACRAMEGADRGTSLSPYSAQVVMGCTERCTHPSECNLEKALAMRRR